MLKNLLVSALTFSIASLILIVSIFRVAEIKYVLSQSPSPTPQSGQKIVEVDYKMPYSGKVQPDSVLWPVKALRDKVWITLTLNPSKKADLYLLIADKRLGDAKTLFEEDKADLGLSVLTKGEKYLESAKNEEEKARKEGMDTKDFLEKFAQATLKHRQVIDQILTIAPDDARPIIIKSEDYSKNLYNDARNNLQEIGAPVPPNPFDSL
jgi:hypothetical protein